MANNNRLSGVSSFAANFAQSFTARRLEERARKAAKEKALKDDKAKQILNQTAMLLKLPKGQRAPFIKQMGAELKVSEAFKGALISADDEYAKQLSAIVENLNKGIRPPLEELMKVFQDPSKGLEFMDSANSQISAKEQGRIVEGLGDNPSPQELRQAARKTLSVGGTKEAGILNAQAKDVQASLKQQSALARRLGLTELTTDMKNFVGTVGGAENFTGLGFTKFMAKKFPNSPVKTKQAVATALYETVHKDNPNFTLGEAWLTVVTGEPLVGKEAWKAQILSRFIPILSGSPEERQQQELDKVNRLLDNIYPVISGQDGSLDDFFNGDGGFNLHEVQ